MSQEVNPPDAITTAIKTVVNALMDRVMHKVLIEDPFVKELHHSQKPLYAALVPDEIFKASHFERRFVTPFGRVWEKLAKAVAEQNHGQCLMGHVIVGNVGDESLRRIQEVLNRLEHTQAGTSKTAPDWQSELTYIKEGRGNPIPVKVICDIYVRNIVSNDRYAFELKGPLPNSDQTKVSKEKMFKLLAMEPAQVDAAFYSLPYNPYGASKADYKWSFPMRWFNMAKDPCILIGTDFWDFMGGTGTYANFIREINQLGKSYRERIYREFLEIEPPTNAEDYFLK